MENALKKLEIKDSILDAVFTFTKKFGEQNKLSTDTQLEGITLIQFLTNSLTQIKPTLIEEKIQEKVKINIAEWDSSQIFTDDNYRSEEKNIIKENGFFWNKNNGIEPFRLAGINNLKIPSIETDETLKDYIERIFIYLKDNNLDISLEFTDILYQLSKINHQDYLYKYSYPIPLNHIKQLEEDLQTMFTNFYNPSIENLESSESKEILITNEDQFKNIYPPLIIINKKILK